LSSKSPQKSAIESQNRKRNIPIDFEEYIEEKSANVGQRITRTNTTNELGITLKDEMI
jgi:hypothetical protein